MLSFPPFYGHHDARKGEEIMAIRTRTSSRSTQLNWVELGGLLPDYITTKTELNELQRKDILVHGMGAERTDTRCCKISSSAYR